MALNFACTLKHKHDPWFYLHHFSVQISKRIYLRCKLNTWSLVKHMKNTALNDKTVWTSENDVFLTLWTLFAVKKGERIAQLICERICYPELQELQVNAAVVNSFVSHICCVYIMFSGFRRWMRRREEREASAPPAPTEPVTVHKLYCNAMKCLFFLIGYQWNK